MLADAVTPALVESKPAASALKRYRRALRTQIIPHSVQSAPYSRGRGLTAMDRFVLRRAARDEDVRRYLIGYISRNLSPLDLMGPRGTLTLLRG
jgi:hypothetical protein